MEPRKCGAVESFYICQLEPGHSGAHREGKFKWKQEKETGTSPEQNKIVFPTPSRGPWLDGSR